MSQQKPLELIYWPIRGLGHALRAVLTFNNVAFVDTRMGDWHDKDSATKARAEKAVPFANLPLLILPNGEGLTQTATLLRFAGSLGETKPKDAVDEANVSMVIDHFVEFHTERLKVCYDADAKDNKTSFLSESIPYYFGKLEEFVNRRKTEYVATNYITAADIWFAEYAAVTEKLTGGLDYLKPYPKLASVYSKVKNNDKLKGFYAKEAATPFNDPSIGAWY